MKNNKAKLEELKENNLSLKSKLNSYFPKSKPVVNQKMNVPVKPAPEARPGAGKSPLPLSRSINITKERYREFLAQETQKSNPQVPERTVERSPNMQRVSVVSTSMNFSRREDVSPNRVSRFLKENEIKARYLQRRERALTSIKTHKKDLYALKSKKYEQLVLEDPSVFETIHKKVKPVHANMLRQYFKQVADSKSDHREMRSVIDKAKQWNKAFLENEVG